MPEVRGFIVAAWESGARLFFSGRLSDGRSFACVENRGEGALYVDEASSPAAFAALSSIETAGSEAWTDMSGRPLVRILLPGNRVSAAERALAASRIGCLGVERGRADEYLALRRIRGPVLIRGEGRKGRRVDVVFADPLLEADEALPPLRWLALDIETDRAQTVVAISLVSPAVVPEGGDAEGGGAGGRPAREGLFVGPDTGLAEVTSFPDEAALLEAAAGRIRQIDPDVLTGWNVVDFDLRVLSARFAAHGLPFMLGRSDEAARLVEKGKGRVVVLCPGRAVIDAMRLIRASGERFDDLRLETVSRNLLGEGKSVGLEGEDKLDELDRLRAGDPAAFVSYCIRDSDLVLRILDKTGLDRLTQARAGLTGLPLDLAWTSIPAFERVYAAGLRERHIAVPKREVVGVSGAAGGTVLDPIAGLFDGVLVFDFRSLYPSVMRTFNIDPLANARARARPPEPGDIVAPNGARFDSEAGILPATIARYAAEREKAIASGDETAAYVYKILQNSFYGVLGAEGCLYARTELAGAVTSFGRKFLLAARDFFEARGYRTLYGDTDSVFVESGLGYGVEYGALAGLGASLADALNDEIAVAVRKEYGRESFLRIRCEKLYRRFFIPRLRLDPDAGERRGRAFVPSAQEPVTARGRAKGYAGLRVEADGSCRVEVKGMEAARSDWTPLARRFQVELLSLAFAAGGSCPSDGGKEGGAGWSPAGDIAAWSRRTAEALRRGELDGELVYRKMLRRPPEDYASASPQVRAARILGWEGRRGSVSFVMTKSGPEPVSRRSGSPLDYDHYAEHQLLPIARALAEGLGGTGPSLGEGQRVSTGSVESWFADRPQMELGF